MVNDLDIPLSAHPVPSTCPEGHKHWHDVDDPPETCPTCGRAMSEGDEEC